VDLIERRHAMRGSGMGVGMGFSLVPEIIRTDRIIGYRNAPSDSISVSFGPPNRIQLIRHARRRYSSQFACIFDGFSSDTVSSFTVQAACQLTRPRSLNAENKNAERERERERECKHEADDLIEPGHATCRNAESVAGKKVPPSVLDNYSERPRGILGTMNIR